ncbi:hypothetical protein [Lacihabitans sp. LS3-19]|nr:hypothetical protein [Lacihabitans sp. LS3-19]
MFSVFVTGYDSKKKETVAEKPESKNEEPATRLVLPGGHYEDSTEY